MRLELTNTDLNALIKGGVPGNKIVEARRRSHDIVLKRTTVHSAAASPQQVSCMPTPRRTKPAVAPSRGLFARLLDALFGVKCWPLIAAVVLCGSAKAIAQADPATANSASEPISDASPDVSCEGDTGQFGALGGLHVKWLFDFMTDLEATQVATEQMSRTGAKDNDTKPAAVTIPDGGISEMTPTADAKEEYITSGLTAPGMPSKPSITTSETTGTTSGDDRIPPPTGLQDEGEEAWLMTSLTVLIIAAMMFLIWQIRGLEVRMERLERRCSLQKLGRLDVCIKGANVEATARSPEPGTTPSLHDDPDAESLPPNMTTRVVVFEDGSAWRTGRATHTGPREDNQDAVRVLTIVRETDNGYEFFDLAGIADGLGGEPGGRRAARQAIEWATASVIAQVDSGATSFKSIVECAMRAASNAIQRDAERLGVQDGLRTTMAIALVSRESGQGAVASIGDSESFIRRSDGCVSRCVHPQKGRAAHQVAACLGPAQIGDHQVIDVELARGDLLILATDGVVQPDEGRLTPEEAAHAVVFNSAVHNCNFSEGALSVIEDNLDRGARDVFGHSLFTDNQTIAIIGTGSSPATVEVPEAYRLSA